MRLIYPNVKLKYEKYSILTGLLAKTAFLGEIMPIFLIAANEALCLYLPLSLRFRPAFLWRSL